MVTITLRDFVNDRTDTAGPFDYAQITYGTLRVAVEAEYDGDVTIATRLDDGRWQWDDGSVWTDIVITAAG